MIEFKKHEIELALKIQKKISGNIEAFVEESVSLPEDERNAPDEWLDDLLFEMEIETSDEVKKFLVIQIEDEVSEFEICQKESNRIHSSDRENYYRSIGSF